MNKNQIEMLALMTGLVKLKYGNLDADIWAEALKAEEMVADAKAALEHSLPGAEPPPFVLTASGSPATGSLEIMLPGDQKDADREARRNIKNLVKGGYFGFTLYRWDADAKAHVIVHRYRVEVPEIEITVK